PPNTNPNTPPPPPPPNNTPHPKNPTTRGGRRLEHLRILRTEDYAEIIESGNLFARKFDETVDNKIIDMIYQIIL
ncbi:MAG: hypothetical protein LBC88_07655, partial [Spirochaetaceae bacterium]|nr:hypothetical protein [Spirochaetaceae bacterium]